MRRWGGGGRPNVFKFQVLAFAPQLAGNKINSFAKGRNHSKLGGISESLRKVVFCLPGFNYLLVSNLIR